MKWELHFSASDNSYELTPEDPPASTLAMRPAEATLVTVIDAPDCEAAVRLKNIFLGWNEDTPTRPS